MAERAAGPFPGLSAIPPRLPYCHGLATSYVGLTEPYDCGNDDYFHPDPRAGSYLATRWNVGASYNRFLARS